VISCAEAVGRLWDYVEHALPVNDARQIDEHIAVCRQCCGEADFAGELRGFLGTHAQERIPPDARGRLQEFLTRLDGDVGGGLR
jgi:anti-sigma factor (TIGR02949 family)